MSLTTESGASERRRVRKRRRNSAQAKPKSALLRNVELGMLLLATPLFLAAQALRPVAIVAAVVIAWLWLVQYARTRQPIFPHTALTLPLLLLGAAGLVGLAVSADPQRAWPVALMLFGGIAWWRFLAHNVAREQQLFLALLLLLAAGLGLALLGMLTTSWNSKVDLLGAAIQPLEQLALRAPAFLRQLNEATHPNRLAALLIQLYPLLLVLILFPVLRGGARLLAGVAWLGTAILLLLAQSRSGWLAGLVVTVVVLLVRALSARSRGGRLGAWLGLGALGALALALAVVLPRDLLTQIWQEPPRATVLGSLQSFGFRQEVWQWALTALHDFPLTGIGLGSFEAAVHRLYPIAIPVDYVGLHAHNLLLQVALDFGLFGLVAYLALLLAATLAVWRMPQPVSLSPAVRWIAFGAWANLLALQVYGLTDAIELGSVPSLLFWFSLALIAAAVQMAQAAAATAEREQAPATARTPSMGNS